MSPQVASINEVDFCSQIASEANVTFRQNPDRFPFVEARVEGYGAGAGHRKRKDLRFYGHDGRLLLCGEVKLPGTPEGRSAVGESLMADAAAKADNAAVQFFFTWNVNEFVLWDRSLFDLPLIDRRVNFWRLGRTLASPQEVAREDNLAFIKTDFLPGLLHDLAEILSGRLVDWSLPPDDIFIRSLESHLDWPVLLASAYILEHARTSKQFRRRVLEWMQEQDWTVAEAPHEQWAKALDNMAKTLAYVWANRLIFYKALRDRFSELPELRLRKSVKTAKQAVAAFNQFFERAVERSGDYEPLLMPKATDWATELMFQPTNALDAWRGALKGINAVDFHKIPADIVGRIFQKLIGPEERHRYGQHFTGDDPVDLINSFCIHDATDTVLDPACGSASFLVRAYYRKRHLDPDRPHLDLIGELFGCDIAMYPAHLATLNLAAREINEEANYPRIVRMNFFDFEPEQPFCAIPDLTGAEQPIQLPTLDAIVGNPPYVRQEKIERSDKSRFAKIANDAWPDLRLTKRSDLHCYFWPAAARLLKPDGYFGFLTSSSWLDVDYGFALQGWLLSHFRLLAVMESAAEPWFEDARVKTCITILQRCDDAGARMANPVRFVRFDRKLAEIIGIAAGEDEESRQRAIERLRDRILNVHADYQDDDMRIVVKVQQELWEDGLRAGPILGDRNVGEAAEESEADEPDGRLAQATTSQSQMFGQGPAAYVAGKWGRYVRAPDFYFDIMRRFGSQFVPFGEVARIRRGITSGCDAFFMPVDITAKALANHKADDAFRRAYGGAPRKDVASGKLRIVKAGDKSIHPIESKYLAPELHNLMKVSRPIVSRAGLNRMVLLVGKPMNWLKTNAPWVWRYLRYGMTAEFASRKSHAVPVPERSTCAARDPWYDLTGLVRPGDSFWPKAHKYRHVVPLNSERVVCNCNLYDLYANVQSALHQSALMAILNSTVVGFWKAFYGRFAGTETTLKTEIVDVQLLEIPDPRRGTNDVLKKLIRSFETMQHRVIGHLVEQQLLQCHSPERARRLADGPLQLAPELMARDRINLDDAIFELLGVGDPSQRKELVAALHRETAIYFREGRVVELQAMRNRAKSQSRRLLTRDLAADIWDAAEMEDTMPLALWLEQEFEADSWVLIPEERPAVVLDTPLLGHRTVRFGTAQKSKRSRHKQVEYDSREQAEMVACLANVGINGEIKLPTDSESCATMLELVRARIAAADQRFQELSNSRTSDSQMQEQLMKLLQRWFVHGRQEATAAASADVDDDADGPDE